MASCQQKSKEGRGDGRMRPVREERARAQKDAMELRRVGGRLYGSVSLL